VEETIMAYRREESMRLVYEMSLKDILLTQDETFTRPVPGGNGTREQLHSLRANGTGARSRYLAGVHGASLSGLNCQMIQLTFDEAQGLLTYVEYYLGTHHFVALIARSQPN